MTAPNAPTLVIDQRDDRFTADEQQSLRQTAGLNSSIDALALWQQVCLRSLRESQSDLSSRQQAILLTVYLAPPPHTVKQLAEALAISKPAICRAIDALSRQGLLKRRKDEEDKRVVHIQRTVKGSVFLSEFADIIMQTVSHFKAR